MVGPIHTLAVLVALVIGKELFHRVLPKVSFSESASTTRNVGWVGKPVAWLAISEHVFALNIHDSHDTASFVEDEMNECFDVRVVFQKILVKEVVIVGPLNEISPIFGDEGFIVAVATYTWTRGLLNKLACFEINLHGLTEILFNFICVKGGETSTNCREAYGEIDVLFRVVMSVSNVFGNFLNPLASILIM